MLRTSILPGSLIAVLDPNGIITRTYYDTLHRPEVVAQNLAGQDVEVSAPPEFSLAHPDENLLSQTVYDAQGRAIASISNDGSIIRTYYDVLGRAISVVRNLSGQDVDVDTPPAFDPDYPDRNIRIDTVYDANGRVVQQIDTSGLTTVTCYDGLSRVVQTIVNPTVAEPCEPYTPSTVPDEDVITSFAYDAAGNQVSTQDADGNERFIEYDALNRLIGESDPSNNLTTYSYDGLGNLITKTDSKNITTKYEYNALNSLTAVVENYKSGYSSDNQTNVRTEYTYDVHGNRLTIRNGRGYTTTFTYDDLGRLISEADPLNHTTAYQYDAAGNRVELTDALDATTYYEYDGLNRLVDIDYPAPDADVTFTYDAAGNRTAMTDGLGTTAWDFDALNRPVEITDPFENTVRYGYDGGGKRTSLTYPDTSEVAYTYDGLGRLVGVNDWGAMQGDYGMELAINDSDPLYVTDWSPEAETHYRARFYVNPIDLEMEEGEILLFFGLDEEDEWQTLVYLTYVEDSYCVGVSVWDESEGWWDSWPVALTGGPQAIEIEWQAASGEEENDGYLAWWLDGDEQEGVDELDNDGYTIDTAVLGAMLGLPEGAAGYLYLDSFESRRDSYIGLASLLSSRQWASAEGAPKAFGVGKQWVALAAAQVRKGFAKSSSPRNVLVFHLAKVDLSPALSPLQVGPSMEITVNYTYDPLGRLTEAAYSDGTYFRYTYDAVGNRLSEQTPWGTVNYMYDSANRLTSAGGVNYTWDDNGNLFSDGVRTYSYDHANRLIEVTQGTDTYTYAYDGLGNRYQQSLNEATTTFVLDINTGLTQVLDDGTYTYLYGVGRIAQYDSSGDPEYFLGDALGSVRQLVDEDGEVVHTQSYEPYGELLSGMGAATTSYGYTGE